MQNRTDQGARLRECDRYGIRLGFRCIRLLCQRQRSVTPLASRYETNDLPVTGGTVSFRDRGHPARVRAPVPFSCSSFSTCISRSSVSLSAPDEGAIVQGERGVRKERDERARQTYSGACYTPPWTADMRKLHVEMAVFRGWGASDLTEVFCSTCSRWWLIRPTPELSGSSENPLNVWVKRARQAHLGLLGRRRGIRLGVPEESTGRLGALTAVDLTCPVPRDTLMSIPGELNRSIIGAFQTFKMSCSFVVTAPHDKASILAPPAPPRSSIRYDKYLGGSFTRPAICGYWCRCVPKHHR